MGKVTIRGCCVLCIRITEIRFIEGRRETDIRGYWRKKYRNWKWKRCIKGDNKAIALHLGNKIQRGYEKDKGDDDWSGESVGRKLKR